MVPRCSGSTGRASEATELRRIVTGALMGDPLPGRFERSEALRRALPSPRPEQPLDEWLGPKKFEDRGLR